MGGFLPFFFLLNPPTPLAARYYVDEGLKTLKEQHAFEKALHTKTRSQYSDIVMLDKQIAVYKNNADATVYVLGLLQDNELILQAVLDTIQGALETLLRTVNKRSMLENYDFVLLVLDEVLDRGIVLETDVGLVCSRVSMSDRPAALTPLHEQTLAQMIDTAKTEIIRGLKQ